MANPSYPNGLHHVQSGYFHLVKDENDDTWATTGNEEAALAVVWIEDTDTGLGDLDTAWLGLSSGAVVRVPESSFSKSGRPAPSIAPPACADQPRATRLGPTMGGWTALRTSR